MSTGTTEERVFVKEMGITHADFMRDLPRALDGSPVVDGRRIVMDKGPGRRLEITFSEEGRRRIAGIELPVTHVMLRFTGFEDGDVETVMKRFNRAYQRGGG